MLERDGSAGRNETVGRERKAANSNIRRIKRMNSRGEQPVAILIENSERAPIGFKKGGWGIERRGEIAYFEVDDAAEYSAGSQPVLTLLEHVNNKESLNTGGTNKDFWAKKRLEEEEDFYVVALALDDKGELGDEVYRHHFKKVGETYKIA